MSRAMLSCMGGGGGGGGGGSRAAGWRGLQLLSQVQGSASPVIGPGSGRPTRKSSRAPTSVAIQDK